VGQDISYLISGVSHELIKLGRGLAGAPGTVAEWLAQQGGVLGGMPAGVADWVRARGRANPDQKPVRYYTRD
jgi:hypothetical protein